MKACVKQWLGEQMPGVDEALLASIYGEYAETAKRLVAEIETLKVGVSNDAGAQNGPVVTAAHRDKIANYIQLGKNEGAELVVDGRGFKLQGYERGFLIGPSLFV